jgi:hypothetical protein
MGEVTHEDLVSMIKRLTVVLGKFSKYHPIIRQAKNLIADEPNDILRAEFSLDGAYIQQHGLGYALAKDINGVTHHYHKGTWSTNSSQIFDKPKINDIAREFEDVYDWLDDTLSVCSDITEGEIGARIFIELMLMPADKQYMYMPILERMVVFGVYKCEVYRCTGASTLGGIYLHDANTTEISGYKHCVLPEEITDWRYTYLHEAPAKEERVIGNVIVRGAYVDK